MALPNVLAFLILLSTRCIEQGALYLGIPRCGHQCLGWLHLKNGLIEQAEDLVVHEEVLD